MQNIFNIENNNYHNATYSDKYEDNYIDEYVHSFYSDDEFCQEENRPYNSNDIIEELDEANKKNEYSDYEEEFDVKEQFFKDINNFEVLPEYKLVKYFKDYNLGKNAREILKEVRETQQHLSSKQIRQYKRKIKLGIFAKEQIILHNIKLVVKIANKYYSDHLKDLDLYQEGIIGLILAIDEYDINNSAKFSTFASYSIKNSIMEAIYKKERTIMIPFNKQKLYKKMIDAEVELTQELCRKPTNVEISNRLDVDVKKIDDLKVIMKKCASTDEMFETDDSETAWNEMLADNGTVDTAYILEKKDQYKYLHKLINNLPEKEQHVIKARYGFNKDGQTLKECGEALGVSAERIRQIENTVLDKCRTKENQEILNVKEPHWQSYGTAM